MKASIGVLPALAASVVLCGLGHPSPTRAQAAEEPVSAASPAAQGMTAWVVSSGDNNGVPFLIIDKPAAAIFVYDAAGQLMGTGPVLLGLALGDESVPGIGDRPLSSIRPEERTTPAGRFLASFGSSPGQGEVLWVDFATAVSLHPVPTGNPKEQRMKRLLSDPADDNRITYGCINVSSALYAEVVRPLLKDSRAVVYILPDTKPFGAVFPNGPD